MKRILILCLIGLIFSSIAFADSKKPSKKLEFKPTFFFSSMMTGIYHRDDGFGLNLVGLDTALFKYRSLYFLDFGIGLAVRFPLKQTWVKFGYYTYEWELDPDGQWKGKKTFNVVAEGWVDYRAPCHLLYFKFVPVKVPLNTNKNMRDKAFLEIGIFSQSLKRIDGIVFGLTFSFDMFKKK